MTNAIIIKRDDQANYVIESDCWGTLTCESLDLALNHLRDLLGQWNGRIESYRNQPGSWSISAISELPS